MRRKEKELTKGTIDIIRHQVKGKVISSTYNGEGDMQKSIEVTFTGTLFDRDPTFLPGRRGHKGPSARGSREEN